MTKKGLCKRHIAFIIFSYIAYFLYASYLNSFGVIASVMMEFYQITSAQQGLVLTIQSTGALAILIYFAMYGELHNKIKIFIAGMLLLGVGSLAVGLTPPYYTTLIIAVLFAGIGFSAADVMINAIVQELFSKHRNTLIPLLQAFFGVGAMTAPMIITAMVNPHISSSFGRPFLLFGILAITTTLVGAIISKRIIPETRYADMETVKKSVPHSPADIFKSRKAWIIISASFLYFSFQVGLMSWLPTHCYEIGMDFTTAGNMLTAFFVGSLIMRFCSPLILRRLSALKSYVLFTLLSALFITVALFMSEPNIIMILIVIGGFMQGGCVSFLVLMAIDAFPNTGAKASALVFISANAASMTAPLWIGALAGFIGFQIPLIIVCGLLALSTSVILLQKNQTR